METELSEPELEEIVKAFWQISQITDDIQRDISIVLTKDFDQRERLSKRLRLSEEEMQKIFDRAIYGMLDAMPLASMNRCNMFTMLMAMHSNVTGDKLLHKVFKRINKQVLETS